MRYHIIKLFTYKWEVLLIEMFVLGGILTELCLYVPDPCFPLANDDWHCISWHFHHSLKFEHLATITTPFKPSALVKWWPGIIKIT